MPVDRGNMRVQERQESFKVMQGGKAGQHTCDPIGRAWACGLLDNQTVDAALLRDKGREYAALYWGYWPSVPGIAGYREMVGRGSVATAPTSRGENAQGISNDPRGEYFQRLDDAARSAGHIAYSALHSLTVAEHFFPDSNPSWLDRLITEALARAHKRAAGILPMVGDHDRLGAAIEALVAMIGGRS